MTRKTAVIVLVTQIITFAGLVMWAIETDQSHLLNYMTPTFVVSVATWPQIAMALRANPR